MYSISFKSTWMLCKRDKLWQTNKPKPNPNSSTNTPYLSYNNSVSFEFARVPMLPLSVLTTERCIGIGQKITISISWLSRTNSDRNAPGRDLSERTWPFEPTRSVNHHVWPAGGVSWPSTKLNFCKSKQKNLLREHLSDIRRRSNATARNTNLSDLIWPWELGLVIAFCYVMFG